LGFYHPKNQRKNQTHRKKKPKKTKPWVSQTHVQRDPAVGLGGRPDPSWPWVWLWTVGLSFLSSSFFLLPSPSFSFLSSLVENQVM
jgi:hypothetical protein